MVLENWIKNILNQLKNNEYFKYFKEIIEKIIKILIITKEDSDILKAKKILWYSAVLSVFVMILLSSFIFVIFTFSTENVKVPMIERDNIYTALNKLYEKRLIPKPIIQYSDDYDAHIVFNQNPKQGLIVKKGSVVTFYVSLGQKDNALPDFRGYDLFELEEFLTTRYKKLPFVIEQPIYEYSDEVEKGKIIRQYPKDGTPINFVKKVKIWVSNGPKQENSLMLRNYVGERFDVVSKELADANIPFSCIFEIVNTKEEHLIIVKQSIGPGKLVSELITEQKEVVLKVNLFLQKKEKDEKEDIVIINLPKKAIPYKVDLKIQHGNLKEKSLISFTTRGGITFPLPCYVKKESRIIIYIEDKIYKTVDFNN